jgi:hypothetical protein
MLNFGSPRHSGYDNRTKHPALATTAGPYPNAAGREMSSSIVPIIVIIIFAPESPRQRIDVKSAGLAFFRCRGYEKPATKDDPNIRPSIRCQLSLDLIFADRPISRDEIKRWVLALGQHDQ